MISGALLDTVPWLLPGAAITLAVSLLGCGPLARAMGARTPVVWLMMMSLGLILAITLTPQRDALELGAVGSGACDFSRVKPARLDFYMGPSDAGENVLMFVPLGVAIALVPASRLKAILVAGAILLPFAIEAVQRQAVVLNRACQSADVVDNLAGLLIGLGIGGGIALVGWVTGRRRITGGPPLSGRRSGDG